MKRSFTNLILLLAYSVIATAATNVASDSSLVFKSQMHDFGKVGINDGPVSWEFEFVNESDSVVNIIGAMSACGCTIPEYPHEPIAPGQAGKVKVTFKPYGRPAEPFEKTITLRTSGSPSVVKLTVKGESVENVKIWQ